MGEMLNDVVDLIGQDASRLELQQPLSSGAQIGARVPPMPNAISTVKGVTQHTGESERRSGYEGMSPQDSSQTFPARATTCPHNPRDLFPSATMEQDTSPVDALDAKRPFTSSSTISNSIHDHQESQQHHLTHIHPSTSPTFSYSSSPETAVSFNFSPVQPRHLLLSRADSQYSYFGSPDSNYGFQPTRREQDSGEMDTSEDTIMTPSTSYASSTMRPASFPYQDHVLPEVYQDKGKGKERETRSPTPVGLEPVDDDNFMQTEVEARPESEHRSMSPMEVQTKEEEVAQSVESDVGSLESESSMAVERPSRIGLSFSEQRFIHHSKSTPQIGSVNCRSRSSHSYRRSPTPVPQRSRSRSSEKHRHRASAPGPSRQRSSILTLLSLAGRGRSPSRPKQSKFRGIRRALTEVSSSSRLNPRRVHALSGVDGNPGSSGTNPAAVPLPPSQPSSTSSSRPLSVAGAQGGVADAAVEEASLGGPEVPSFRLSGATDVRFSTEGLAATHTEVSLLTGTRPPSPSPAASSLPPPRLRFVGRANTAPAMPYTEISSTFASAPTASALVVNGATGLLMPPTTSGHFRPSSPSSNLLGNSSIVYPYLTHLTPLMRPVPQPDGCGQILIEDAPVTPGVVMSTSPFSSTRSRHRVFAGRSPWDLFDVMLPYELRIEVFRTLLRLHVAEHDALMKSEDWSVGVASGTFGTGLLGKREQRHQATAARWVGLERGLKELVKISRVSREWQALSLDGQLWATTSFKKFPNIPTALLHRITRSVGPFMKTFDLSGVSGITPSVFLDLVDNVRTVEAASVHYGTRRRGEDESVHEMFQAVFPVPPSRCTAMTQLTTIDLGGCSALTTRALHHLLVLCPLVEWLSLRGLNAVTNATCELIGENCSARLVKLDLGKCPSMSASGIEEMIGTTNSPASFRSFSASSRPRFHIPARRLPKLKELRLGGLKRITGQTMFSIAWGIPDLEVLDVSGAKTLDDEGLEVFVRWDDRFNDSAVLSGQLSPSVLRSRDAMTHLQNVEPYERVTLTSRQMGFNPMSAEKYFKRVTRLRHLSVSSCPLLTDAAASHLAFAVPRLEFLEMGGVGAAIRDAGLMKLFETTPWIRRLDLEDASEITDAVLDALTPPPPAPLMDQRRRDVDLASGRMAHLKQPAKEPSPGEMLEQIILSYAGHLTDNALLAFVSGCSKLRSIELDNTRASDTVVKEFVRMCRRRQISGAEVLAVDCRNVTRNVTTEGTALMGLYMTRNRRGYRDWEARALGYYDERDRKDKTSGTDAIGTTTQSAAVANECDERRVVVKSFHSWQAVDSMTEAREKRRKSLMASNKNGDNGGDSPSSSGGEGTRTPRWLSWRSMSSGARTPVGAAGGRGEGVFDFDGDDRGCVIM